MIQLTSSARMPLLAALCAAALAAGPATALDTSRPEARKFIDELSREHGFDRDYLGRILAGSERQQSILDAISRPAERTKPWHEYRAIFVTPERIAAGVEFWHQHGDTLARVATETGVPAEIITAIIGVETYYGRITGRYRVLDALSTLGFDYPPRQTFFRGQLAELFLLAREENLDINAMLGSYAGAMGAPQFIPSSYRHYAVDGDGDGVRDLFGSWDDVIASVANYFKAHRWRPDGPVAALAVAAERPAPKKIDNGLKADTTLAGLTHDGLRFDTGLPADTKAGLVALENADGVEYWAGFHNFYVITRYNRSTMYAMAVYQLGRELRAARDASMPPATRTAGGER